MDFAERRTARSTEPCRNRNHSRGLTRLARPRVNTPTKEDAEKALAAQLLQIEPEKPKTPGISFGQACERYLAAKSRKRSLENDTRIVKHLKAELGADTPLGEITRA